MSDLLKRIEGYSDPDMLFGLDDFADVADVMRGARERIAELEKDLAAAKAANIAIRHAALDLAFCVGYVNEETENE